MKRGKYAEEGLKRGKWQTKAGKNGVYTFVVLYLYFFVYFRGLLSSVQHCADWTGATDKQESIQKCFRCLESIFKFIVESRLLFSRATNGQYEESFKRDLYTVLASLNQVLASCNPHILDTQVTLPVIITRMCW